MTTDPSAQILLRARDGDERAFAELTEPYRRELQLHCYRLCGSVQDAEDLVQEVLMAAWRSLDRFEARASLRTWLHRLATNRTLDHLRASGRRPKIAQPMPDAPPPTRMAEPLWLQPYPDALLDGLPDTSPAPDSRYELREAVSLAFVAGLQRLPPLGRAVLVLRDVLGYRAAEVAEMLDLTEASVNGQLARARASLQARLPPATDRVRLPDDATRRKVLERFVAAMELGDVDAVVALLTDDAWVTMPPQPHEYQGRDVIRAFLSDRWGRWPGRVHVVPTAANLQPAVALYLEARPAAIAHAYGLVVLELADDAIATMTYFSDTAVFPTFGLPRSIPVDEP